MVQQLKGKSMEEALIEVFKDGKKVMKKVKATAIYYGKDDKRPDFFCTDCRQRVSWAKGRDTAESNPYFKQHRSHPHLEGCSNIRVVRDLDKRSHEAGVDSIVFGVKVPSNAPRTNTKNPTNSNQKGVTTRKSSSKGKDYIHNVDDLFQTLDEISQSENKVTLMAKIRNSLYFPYSKESRKFLFEKSKEGSVIPYFFVTGKVSHNGFLDLKKSPSYLVLYPSAKDGMEIRLHPVNKEVKQTLNAMTFEARKEKEKLEESKGKEIKWYTKYIGAHVSYNDFERTRSKLILNLTVYEVDVDRYKY